MLVALKVGIDDDPEAARLMLVLLFCQAYDVLATLPAKLIAATAPLLQTTILPGSFTVGVGITFILKVIGEPAHK